MAATLAALPGGAWGAEIYRWTDAEGRPHFGDRPPDGDAAVVDIPASPSDTAPAAPAVDRDRLLEAYRKGRERRRREAEVQARQTAEEAARCQAASRRLAGIDRSGLLYRSTPSGEREYLSDEERRAERRRTAAAVTRWCD